MGCFFGCFRFGHYGSATNRRRRSPLSDLTPSVTERVASRNRSPLSALFVSEENEERNSLQSKGEEKQGSGSPLSPELELDVKELKDQAKFLKSCGTLPETPLEIWKLSEKCSDLSAQKCEDKPLKFHSWLSADSPIEKQKLLLEADQSPPPTKDVQESAKEADSFHTPSSCMTYDEENSNTTTFQSDSPAIVPPSTACRQRSVRFDCKSDSSSTLSSSAEVASPNSKASPNPTPLKLTDDMQTPGTVFPTYVDYQANGRNPRIRSQYVYSVLNPIENASQLKKVVEEDSASMQDSNSNLFSDVGESVELCNEVNSTSKMGFRETRNVNNSNVEASLSSWLKPPINKQSSTQCTLGSIRRGRAPGDRPIIGMVAAHWNENETPNVMPKWWDGNGIPNSTHKYKEDQKVSWHATPFEERLEKALSEETLISQRKKMSASPIGLKESEESDTALSQLQSTSHS